MTDMQPVSAGMMATETQVKDDEGQTGEALWMAMLAQWIDRHPLAIIQKWMVMYGLRHALPENDNARRLATDILYWLDGPDDALRWAIFDQLETVGYESFIGGLGASVFLSGSLTPEGQPAVYPPDGVVTELLLSGAKLLVVSVSADGDFLKGVRRLLSERPDGVAFRQDAIPGGKNNGYTTGL
ncbi:TPA: hypothetical protein G8O00_000942 [Salmonella enterica]|uniref:Uncharacterized protein n=1 Tax=Salmonella enterica TaxID=28901 RepID=A0A747XGJ5_SALER|nr:hypothetical protein [Salmonella enterica]HAF4697586.1 hypothetical protein [Salmonella enterica]